jgi:hypothetical protein
LKLLLEDDTESNDAWQDILRFGSTRPLSLCLLTSPSLCLCSYGYTDESKRRIEEIDRQLAEYGKERLTASSTSLVETQDEVDDEGGADVGVKLPMLVPSVANSSDQVDEKEASRPEKVLGDNYLKEQVRCCSPRPSVPISVPLSLSLCFCLCPSAPVPLSLSSLDSSVVYQKMATVRKKYSQQLDLLLTMVHSQVSLGTLSSVFRL